MGKVALIDGDIIAYSCGFASDGAASKDGMKFEPWGFCRHGVDATIQSIKDAVGATEHIVVLTAHGGGYRDDTFPDYKAGRKAEKPYHYDAIRQHLLDFWGGFESSDGKEADDELGIMAGENPDAIICSKDKDLDGVPGWHYNFSKTRKHEGVYMVTKVEADRFFYKQMLTGDSTDNIPGMYRVLGLKATSKWLEPIESMKDPAEMYAYVREVYGTLYTEQKLKGRLPKTTGIPGLDSEAGLEAFLLFLGTLLWIQRKDGGMFVPPTGLYALKEDAATTAAKGKVSGKSTISTLDEIFTALEKDGIASIPLGTF
jgi:5'-3' exonuclease